jgi:redox-sensitive bicupin YhaK (pirin superfamily)
MGKLRHVDKRFRPRLVVEGAGVHLHRAFGYHEVPLFDPFLLFDDFRCTEPRLYQSGFPWHPHRGIITVTYLLAGSVEHQDSLGNKGTIGAGELQWMTAGSGIIHQEMPVGNDQGHLEGFQLWINLPACYKLVPPAYRQIGAEGIPRVESDEGLVRVISGRFGDVSGPIQDDHIDVTWLDVTLPPKREFHFPARLGDMVCCYGIDGEGFLPYREANGQVEYRQVLHNRQLFLFENGEQIVIRTGDEALRFFLFSGHPLSESVAWRGPVVMNTQEEIDLAFAELNRGEFIRHPAVGNLMT